jgi:hypothetical protein
MAAETPKPFSLSPQVKNVIIGVTTTVLVSTVVYFLGFNKKSSTTRLETQKATTQAWKTYVTIENIAAKNMLLLVRDQAQFGSYKELYQETLKESDKFINSLKSLSNNESIDKDMIAMLKRRAESEETSKPRSERFYNELDQLLAIALDKDWTDKRFQDSLIARSAEFEKQNKRFFERAINEIESLSKNLGDRYDATFNIDDFIMVQMYKYKKDPLAAINEVKTDTLSTAQLTKEYFTGKWDASGATVTLNADDKWTWVVPLDTTTAEGTWELKEGKLLLSVPKHPKTGEKGSWTFNLSDITENSFSMKLSKEPYNYYFMIRKD